MNACAIDFRSLFERSPHPAMVLDRELRYVAANEAYLRVTASRLEDLLGRHVIDAFPHDPDDPNNANARELRASFERVLASGEPDVLALIPYRVPMHVGDRIVVEERFWSATHTPLFDDQGAVAFILQHTADVTVQKRLEAEREALLRREQAARAEAEQANRLKDEFLAMVSHELRTPLNALLGWVRMLRAGHVAAERQARVLETVERNARAQAKVIDDLLDVSRIVSGKFQLEVAPVALSAVVESALESLRPAAEAKGIFLSPAIPPGVTVLGDENRLHQVAWHLVSNAVKFTPANGHVDVQVAPGEDAVQITVSDSGKGIAPEFVPHLFERFRQADAGTTRAHGGLGLGLTLVKQIVDLHGGTIAASSAGEGRGAIFTVSLPVGPARRAAPDPVAQPAVGASPATWPCPPELAGLRLLVVEDEPDTRDLLRSVLERCGAHVETAASAAEALERIRSARPALIVSDVTMPGEDGYTFMRWVRALGPEEGGRTPAIALTAHARAADRTRALVAGFKAHVPKPIEPAELIAVLVSVIRQQDHR